MSKAEVVKWCLDNSFELINMICEEDEEDDEEGILSCLLWHDIHFLKIKKYIKYQTQDVVNCHVTP